MGQQRYLVVGWGDVAQRMSAFWPEDVHLTIASRGQVDDAPPAATVMRLDLDTANLNEDFSDDWAQSFDAVIYTVPPASGGAHTQDAQGAHDTRLQRLLNVWSEHHLAPRRMIYISTTGVYGDCAGAWVDESTPVHAESARAQRRVAAEQALQQFAQTTTTQVVVLRAPGIYALERLPLASVVSGAPVMCAAEDSFSNHIHADDLARACLWFAQADRAQGRVFEIINACDDVPLLMGQWLNALAQAAGEPPLPTCTRAQMQASVAPMRWSFMRESRRIRNERLKATGFALHHPSAVAFVQAHSAQIRAQAQVILAEQA